MAITPKELLGINLHDGSSLYDIIAMYDWEGGFDGVKVDYEELAQKIIYAVTKEK